MSKFTFKPADWVPYKDFDPEMMARFEGIPRDGQQKIIEKAAAAGTDAEIRRIGREIMWY